MSSRVRDIVLVICAISCVCLATAALVVLVKTRDLTQRALDEAREGNAHDKRIEARVGDIADDVHPKAVSEGLDRFHYECYTSASEAVCEMTNLGAAPARTCLRGIVTRKSSSATAESVVVCTGEIQPKESKTVQAIFRVNAIRKLCPGDYGGVSWDDCSFDVVDMTNAVTKAVKTVATP